MTEADRREHLGRLVHAERLAWCADQGDRFIPATWEERTDGQREMDRRIGEAVAAAERERIRPLVTQWRTAAEHLASTNAAWSSHFYDCASELERFIGTEGQAPPSGMQNPASVVRVIEEEPS